MRWRGSWQNGCIDPACRPLLGQAGKCCLHKLEDDETGDVWRTNVACRLLDLTTARCGDYRHRKALVPDCLRLTPKLVEQVPWLPETCAYRLRGDGRPLPEWHYLECGDRDAVHRAGQSVVGRAISEVIAGPLEDHIVDADGVPLYVDDGAFDQEPPA
jgi:uncharacterized cysteine cluster protein YcgN (CxxCxxCC family)